MDHQSIAIHRAAGRDRRREIRRHALTEDDVALPPREQPLLHAPPFLAEEARHEGLGESETKPHCQQRRRSE
jgi:hypothetical protein